MVSIFTSVNKKIGMEISVLFFGVLVEVTGTHCRHYRGISSFSDLRYRIIDDFPEIENYNFRIAINNKIVNDSPLLKDKDEVVCMPPFLGG